MLWSGRCRRPNTRTSKCSSACSVANTLNAGQYGVKLRQPLIWTHRMRQATATVRIRIAKYSETISVSIVRGWLVKTQSVSDTSGTGVILLMAQHNGITVTQMEMGMTTGVNRQHFVCARVGACVCACTAQTWRQLSGVALPCAAVGLCYYSQTNRLWPSNKTNFLYFGTVSFEMWCWRSLEKIGWADRVGNEELLQTFKEYPTDTKKWEG
jgi:hypothetical protein